MLLFSLFCCGMLIVALQVAKIDIYLAITLSRPVRLSAFRERISFPEAFGVDCLLAVRWHRHDDNDNKDET
jgi:hypothetical protein